MTEYLQTPENWSFRDSSFDDSVWEIIADWCESPIAEIPRWRDEDGQDSSEAAAIRNLIVAAPKLLDACRLVVERWETGDLAEAVRSCRAAIDAITGSEPSLMHGEPAIAAILASRRQISAVWNIADVQEARPDLDDDQAWEVLKRVEERHDCTRGITWETLEEAAEFLYPELEDD